MPISNNRIKNVAIVGATGRVGGAFTTALLATGLHKVTALRHSGSKGTLPSGVHTAEINYDDPESITAALKDQDFLIITLSVRAPPDTSVKLLAGAKAAGIQWVMPNVYGGRAKNKKTEEESMYAQTVAQRIREVEEAGLNHVTLTCGFWYEWSLGLPDPWFGFTIAQRKVTFYDDGETKITVSTWDQCGRAIAALLSLPVQHEGSGPALEDWKDKALTISSFEKGGVSQRMMLDSLNRVLGTKDSDWQISKQPTQERYLEGLAEMGKGQMTGFAKSMYARMFYPNGDGNYEEKVQNDILGLPKEDLDEATKRTVDMVESGWDPLKEMGM